MLLSLLGIVLLLATAFALSTNRRAIRLRVVGAAFALHVLAMLFVLRTPVGTDFIAWLTRGAVWLLSFSQAGTAFIFGDLADPANGGTSFALQALTVIVFFASLTAVLEYVGFIALLVRWIGGAIRVITGVSRVESLGAAANIFIGQGEAPLVIQRYLESLTRSQMFTLMTVGMASVAGSVMAAYIAMLGSTLAPYLLAAALLSAPAGILMAKIVVPDEDDQPAQSDTPEGVGDQGERPANVIMAAADGAFTGLKLAASVGVMLFAFISLVALANGILGGIGGWFGFADLSFELLLGYAFAPVMFVAGVPWEEAQIAGSLFGQKIVLNEFVAFLSLADETANLSPRGIAITTFALCGFANFSSIAIQLGAIGTLAPGQKHTIAKLGLRALCAASLANLMSATLAGLFLPT